MAMPDSIGTATCGNPGCGCKVYVRKNRGGFVYYRCEACTFEGRFHAFRHSDAFLNKSVVLEAAEVPVFGASFGKVTTAGESQKAVPVAPVIAAKEPKKPAAEKTKAAPGSLAALMAGG